VRYLFQQAELFNLFNILTNINISTDGTTRLKEFTEFIGFPNKELVQKFLSDKDLLMKIRNANCLRLRV